MRGCGTRLVKYSAQQVRRTGVPRLNISAAQGL